MKIRLKEAPNYFIDNNKIIYNSKGLVMKPKSNGTIYLYCGKKYMAFHVEKLYQQYFQPNFKEDNYLKEIPFLPDYFINTKGEIYTTKEGGYFKQMKINIQDNGYCVVRCYKNNKNKLYLLHRLVMITFCSNLLIDGFDVNHIDGDKTNNDINNLEWCTRAENIQHALDNNLNHCRKCVGMFNQNKLIKEFKSITEAQEYMDKPKGTAIGKCVRGERKTAYGYKWKFI